jgi:hypothetical protein
MENNREIERTGYEIRKLERGIKVAHKCLLDIKGTSVDYDFMIKQYVKDIKELRDGLERLTGRRQPNIPKWPI